MSERNIPQKPVKSEEPRYGMGYEYFDWVCPTCGRFLAYEPNPDGIPKRCQNCTQLLLREDSDRVDRYETHIIRCLENAVKNAIDGVECHIDAVTVQGVIDLLNEKIEQIEKLSQNSMNLKELWEKARNGESLTENEHKFLLADWDERNGYNQQKDGDGE